MPQKFNKYLLISLVLGVLYMVYIFTYMFSMYGSGSSNAEDVGIVIGMLFILPHVICALVAVIFNGLGMFMKKKGFALAGAILYAVSMVLMPIYFFFVIIQMTLSFVGYSKMKKEVLVDY